MSRARQCWVRHQGTAEIEVKYHFRFATCAVQPETDSAGPFAGVNRAGRHNRLLRLHSNSTPVSTTLSRFRINPPNLDQYFPLSPTHLCSGGVCD